MDQQLNSNGQQEQLVPPPQKPLSKTWQIAAIVVTGILVIGGVSYGSYYWWQNYSGGQKACTMEAKQCEDGSSVGRTGPNCEFAACPSVSASPDPTADWQIYKNEQYGFEIKLPLRWANYRVEQKDNVIEFSLKVKQPLISSDGTKEEYHKVFSIVAYTKNQWEEVKTQEPLLQNYLKENDQYVFTYFVGQDDEGYVGFPDVIVGQKYEGPFSDVANKITPTFKFTK